MKKTPKNIPTYYNFPGTPIFRDTTALPFADGGPLNDKTNHGKILNSVYASALDNYYANGGPINTSGPRNITESEIIPQGTEMSPDYDLKRFYVENPMGAESFMVGQGHATDEYKLPNHPTFSDHTNWADGSVSHGSLYSNTETLGGEWVQNQDGTWHFNASQINRNNMSEEEMKQYFNEVEPGNTIKYKDGGQFQGKYSLPEDSFKQGGNNLHNSVYASSPQQYPAVYNFGGTLGNNLSTRQQMYMPLDHITRTGGSILSMSNTPEMSGEGKDLVYANGGALNNSYGGGGQIYTYAGRPGAEYKKIGDKWQIKTEYNPEFTFIQDPTGKRTTLLNTSATPI